MEKEVDRWLSQSPTTVHTKPTGRDNSHAEHETSKESDSPGTPPNSLTLFEQKYAPPFSSSPVRPGGRTKCNQCHHPVLRLASRFPLAKSRAFALARAGRGKSPVPATRPLIAAAHPPWPERCALAVVDNKERRRHLRTDGQQTQHTCTHSAQQRAPKTLEN